MDLEATQAAPSPPTQQVQMSGGAEREVTVDADGEDDEMANSSAIIQDQLVNQQQQVDEANSIDPNIAKGGNEQGQGSNGGFAFNFSQANGQPLTQIP